MFQLKDDAAFKQHLRDFLVQTKSFADKNNADLYAEEAAQQREVSAFLQEALHCCRAAPSLPVYFDHGANSMIGLLREIACVPYLPAGSQSAMLLLLALRAIKSPSSVCRLTRMCLIAGGEASTGADTGHGQPPRSPQGGANGRLRCTVVAWRLTCCLPHLPMIVAGSAGFGRRPHR